MKRHQLDAIRHAMGPVSFGTRVGAQLDRVLAIFAPRLVAQRVQARVALEAFAQGGGYDAGRRDRIDPDWIGTGGSADADMLPALEVARRRSRDLARNNPLAAAAVETLVNHIVGKGITPQSAPSLMARGMNKDSARRFADAAELAWERWARRAELTDRMNFAGLQTLNVRSWIEGGEFLNVRSMVQRWGTPYLTVLEAVETDRLSNPDNLADVDTLRGGVQLDPTTGAPVAYHLARRHPGDLQTRALTTKDNTWRRVDARDKQGRPNVFHGYVQHRPHQTRGFPMLAPSMKYFRHLERYMDAVVVTARIAACFGLIFKQTDPYSGLAGMTTAVDNGQRITEIEPGMVGHIGPNEDVVQVEPRVPGPQFESFMEQMVRAIGAAAGMPYEMLAKNFSKTNYSSARAALLEAWAFIGKAQTWFVDSYCQPVWELVLEEASLRGDLPVEITPEDFGLLTRARWAVPNMGWVDPEKETKAGALAVQSGLSTLADECAQRGRDWEDVQFQRARERDLLKELGLETANVTEPATAPSSTAPSPDDTDEEES